MRWWGSTACQVGVLTRVGLGRHTDALPVGVQQKERVRPGHLNYACASFSWLQTVGYLEA